MIDILLATYNGEKYLPYLLSSIENQTCKEEKTEQCLILENKISKILIKMRDEFAGLVNGINILDADEETVKYILKVRHALDEMEKNIKYN